MVATSTSEAPLRGREWPAVVGIVLLAACLFPPITSVGPLTGEIESGTGLSTGSIGLLITLPVLAFGLISPFAPRLAQAYGMERAIFGCLIASIAGIGMRTLPGVAPLFAGTVIVGGAGAVAMALVPALIKRDFPHRQGTMTAAYAAVLGAASGIAAAIAVPLATDLDLGWEGALGFWALPVAVTAAVWLPRALASGPATLAIGVPAARDGLRLLVRMPLAWIVTAYWGLQAFSFYTTVGWLPEILIAEGLSEAGAGVMLSACQIAGVVSSLAIPALAERRPDQRHLAIATSLLGLAGLLGLWLGGADAVLVWVTLIGLSQGSALALGLMFFVLRSRDHSVAAGLAGMGQSGGYLFAAAGPALGGLLHDMTGGWGAVLALLGAAAFMQLVVGLEGGRDREVYYEGTTSEDAATSPTPEAR